MYTDKKADNIENPVGISKIFTRTGNEKKNQNNLDQEGEYDKYPPPEHSPAQPLLHGKLNFSPLIINIHFFYERS
jgi:hypothetical protein